MIYRHLFLLALVPLLLSQCRNEAGSANDVESKAALAGKSKDYRQAYHQGRKDALSDVERGVYAIEVYGLPPPPSDKPVPEPKYEIRSVAGCVVSETIIGHADGYNSVSQPAIQKHFQTQP